MTRLFLLRPPLDFRDLGLREASAKFGEVLSIKASILWYSYLAHQRVNKTNNALDCSRTMNARDRWSSHDLYTPLTIQ